MYTAISRGALVCALVLLASAISPASAQCPGCTAGCPDLRIVTLRCIEVTPGVYRAEVDVQNCGTVDITTQTIVEFQILESPPFDGRIKRKALPGLLAGATTTVTSGAMNTGTFGSCSATVDVTKQVSECVEDPWNTALDCPFLTPQECCYQDAGFGIPLPYECSTTPAGTPCL